MVAASLCNLFRPGTHAPPSAYPRPTAFSPIGSKNPCYALAPYAPVAQLDRASDYESEGRKFESSRVRNEDKRPTRVGLFALGWKRQPGIARDLGYVRTRADSIAPSVRFEQSAADFRISAAAFTMTKF